MFSSGAFQCSSTRPHHLPGIEASLPPAATLAWNALKRTHFEKHKCHLCFRAVEIFDSLPTVYRKFRPSCAGLAIDRRHRSNQIESHCSHATSEKKNLARAWCGLQDRSRGEPASLQDRSRGPASLQDRSRGAGLGLTEAAEPALLCGNFRPEFGLNGAAGIEPRAE